MKSIVLARAAIVMATAAAAACGPQRDEVARVNSPDDAAAALIIREDVGGAAGSRGYLVYIVPERSQSKAGEPVVEASHCDGIHVEWLSRNTLSVRYQSTCEIFAFRNRWYDRVKDGDASARVKSVEIILDRDSAVDVTDH